MGTSKGFRIAKNQRKILPAVKKVGSAYATRVGRLPGVGLGINLKSSFGISAFQPNGKDAGATLHAQARRRRNLPFGAENHVDSRAELDQAYTLAGGAGVTDFFLENDSPRDQSATLLEHHSRAVSVNGDDVLLILRRCQPFARDQEFALLIIDAGNAARDRRPVYGTV